MTIAVQLMPSGVEEAHFKRVPEGWLFTVANPWIVAPRRTYLVTDAQKPAIAARVRLGRYVRLTVLLPIVLLMVAVLTIDPTLLNSLSVKTAMVFGVFAVILAGAFTAADYLTVRPLIRHLPRTSQKISLADMLWGQTAAMSTKSLMILTFFSVMIAAGLFLICPQRDLQITARKWRDQAERSASREWLSSPRRSSTNSGV